MILINNDTLSGAGTTHCTNGIVVQQQVSTASPYLPSNPSWPNRHRQSVPPLEDEVEYNTGRRQGPLPIGLSAETMILSQGDRVADFTWILTRLQKRDSLILGQVGNEKKFLAGRDLTLCSDVMMTFAQALYLPTIPTSPTQLSTVYRLLERSIAVADRLQQTSVVIVLNQAIYSKTQEIVWKHRAQFQEFNCRWVASTHHQLFLLLLESDLQMQV